MARLIDADDLVSWLKSCVPPNGKVTMDVLVAAIDSRPAIDAAPVVRCKDCVQFKLHCFGNNKIERPACVTIEEDGREHFAVAVDPEGYCSYGKRKP
jgi:hypothetical protein